MESSSYKRLIIGLGEVGTALWEVFGHSADGMDKNDQGSIASDEYDVIHICFPYFKGFEDEVRMYGEKFLAKGGVIVIHSTVPLGTTRKIRRAIHVPIRGVHPFMVEGIRTFPLHVGGIRFIGSSAIEMAIGLLSKKGINIVYHDFPETTEALKLWDTTQYGKMILLEKEIYDWCEKNNVPFDEVYTGPNEEYDFVYTKLGKHNVVRPYLKHVPGKIGGHCVVENAALLDADSAREIVEKNEEL